MDKWVDHDLDNFIWVGTESGKQICVLGLTEPKPNGAQRRDWAKLIAAAPDMYEALTGLLENYKYNKGEGLGISPIFKGREALAKARGGLHE